jgi:hypothetical protein
VVWEENDDRREVDQYSLMAYGIGNIAEVVYFPVCCQ